MAGNKTASVLNYRLSWSANVFGDYISDCWTLFSKVHLLNSTEIFVSKSLINRSSELETESGAHLISYWEIKGAQASFSGVSAVSEGEPFACRWNEYSKWGIDWPLWETSTLNLLVEIVSENKFAYILQKLQDISCLGRIQTTIATRFNYLLIESISYFLNTWEIELCFWLAKKFITFFFFLWPWL